MKEAATKRHQRSKQVAFRVRPEDLDRIDALADTVSAVAPLFSGFNSRSSIIRYLMFRGIEVVEAEYRTTEGP